MAWMRPPAILLGGYPNSRRLPGKGGAKSLKEPRGFRRIQREKMSTVRLYRS